MVVSGVPKLDKMDVGLISWGLLTIGRKERKIVEVVMEKPPSIPPYY
jgi:hypothetical protein